MTWKTRQRSELGRLTAITSGNGTKVVLIHGVGLRAEAWGAQIDALAKHCRVVAVDMPGHGQSAPLGATSRLADFTDVIAAQLSGSAIIIGHSFGAMIALDMANRYPDKVRAVAALNGIYRRDPAAQAAVIARADGLDGVTMADPTATLERWFGLDASPEREACRTWLCSMDPAGYRNAYRVFAHENGPLAKDLAQLGCPALFLTGADEPNSTPAMSRRMAELAPFGRAEILANAAHMLPMTHPSQTNAILTEFVEANAQ